MAPLPNGLRRARSIGSLVTGLLILAGPFAAPVAAHAELLSAMPGPDEVVTEAPETLVAQFTEPLILDRSGLAVLDAAGATVAEGNEPGAGAREMQVALPALGPGRYEVRWRSFSSLDQEADRGTFAFTVGGAASPGTSPDPGAPIAPAAVDPVALVLPIVATLGGLGGIGAWLSRRRLA